MPTTDQQNLKRGQKSTQKQSDETDFGLMTSQEFSQKKYPRRWLIESVLVDRDVAVIGGPKKTLKTHIALDMAISIGSGRRFLGHFDVPKPRRVVVFSGETSAAGVRDAALRICKSKSISLCEDCDVLWAEKFPQLGTVNDRNALRNALKRVKAKVAIFDPLYLTLFDGANANSASNLFAVGVALRKISCACLESGATPILVHHMSKGANKKNSKTDTVTESLDLDDLAWSGVAEFARQWLLLNRREPYSPGSGFHRLQVVAGGSAGHSSRWRVDVDEGTMDSGFRGRSWNAQVLEHQKSNFAPVQSTSNEHIEDIPNGCYLEDDDFYEDD